MDWTLPCNRKGRTRRLLQSQNLAQCQTKISHRSEIKVTQSSSDKEALESHAPQEKELFIEKVLKHSGDPTKPSTVHVRFLCKVSQLEDLLVSNFKDSNTLTKVTDYIKDHDDYKPLLPY